MVPSREIPAPRGAVTLAVHHELEAARDAWHRLEAEAGGYPYARFRFVHAWAAHRAAALGLEPRVFVATRNGRPVMVLPLALGREGGVPMLLALSDSHTNLNGGLWADGWDVEPAALVAGLLALEPKAEGVSMCCLPGGPDGSHPLLPAPCPSVHDVYGADMADGFAEYLQRHNGKRKRKKHRRSAKRFDEAGGWEVRRVSDANEAERLLDVAREWFAERFREEGITDPFAAPSVRAFMVDALRSSVACERPAMALWVLEIDGEPVSFEAAGGAGAHLSLMFTCYRRGRWDGQAPGDFLLYEVLERSAAAGYTSFDLGRGREPYKASWCDRTLVLHDLRVGRSPRARLWLAAQGGVQNLKRRVRSDERLWSLAKSVRRRIGRAA